MKQIQSHILDLTQIDGNGEFLCPRCGNRISPDDCTEEDYSILEIKMETESLDEVIIQCNTCATTIHLTGFSLLQKLSGSEIGKRETEKEEKDPCYVVHV
jgi:phage terminase large subunit GpA-like protein